MTADAGGHGCLTNSGAQQPINFLSNCELIEVHVAALQQFFNAIPCAADWSIRVDPPERTIN